MNRTASLRLRRTFSDVLGDMAFIFVVDPDETDPPPRYTLEAHVSYAGPRRGTLRLRCDDRFAATVAGNLLGIDPDDGVAERGRIDALQELMNVVCGNVVTELYGPDELFQFGIPEVGPVRPGETTEEFVVREVHTFMLDDSAIELTHIVES